MRIALLLLMVLSVLGCQGPDAGTGTGTIRVAIQDTFSPKTVSPEGNTDISHYTITLENIDSGETIKAEYIRKSDAGYTAEDVRVGRWKAIVEVFAENIAADGGYARIAEAESEPVALFGGEDAVITVTLDSILDLPSGSVAIELLMPPGLERKGDRFTWEWSITGLGSRSDVSIASGPIDGIVLDGGTTGPLELEDAEGEPLILMQGAYMLTVSISGNGVERSSSEIMRLIEGLHASGTIDLSSTGVIVPDAMAIEVVNTIGNLISLETEDGSSFYPVTIENGTGTFSIKVIRGADTAAVSDMSWFVDGETAASASFDAASGMWTISIPGKGRHIVTGVFQDDALLMEGGSIVLTVLVSDPVEFMPKVADISIETINNKVFLSTLTEDTEIHYTIDGTEPGRESPVYTEDGIELADNLTVKAIGYKEGYHDSAVSERECRYLWLKAETPENMTGNITSVAYADGTFIAVDNEENLAASEDGIHWEAIEKKFPGESDTNGNALAWFNGRLYGVPQWGTGLYASDDLGVTWTAVEGVEPVTSTALKILNGKLFYVAWSNVLVTEDGTSWKECIPAGNCRAAAYGDGYYFFCNGTNLYRVSEDLSSYETFESPISDGSILAPLGYDAMFFSDGRLIIGDGYSGTGTSGCIFYSDDYGETWIQVPKKDNPAEGYTVNDFEKIDGIIYSVGFNCLTSSADNGLTWTNVFDADVGGRPNFMDTCSLVYGDGRLITGGRFSILTYSNILDEGGIQ